MSNRERKWIDLERESKGPGINGVKKGGGRREERGPLSSFSLLFFFLFQSWKLLLLLFC